MALTDPRAARHGSTAGYERLYLNVEGVADYFAAFWRALAERFRGAGNILAFELLNEPFAGNYFEHPTLLLPGHADRMRLAPFYDKVAAELRRGDADRMIMFEPTTWSDEFGFPIFDTGFEHAPGGSEYANRSIFSYHFYENVNLGDPVKYFEVKYSEV